MALKTKIMPIPIYSIGRNDVEMQSLWSSNETPFLHQYWAQSPASFQLQSNHCIRIPCIRKWGAVFSCRIHVLICFVMFCGIYLQMEIKKLRGPGILKAKKFTCLWRSLFSGTVSLLYSFTNVYYIYYIKKYFKQSKPYTIIYYNWL